jgi:hypothetical protein
METSLSLSLTLSLSLSRECGARVEFSDLENVQTKCNCCDTFKLCHVCCTYLLCCIAELIYREKHQFLHGEQK